MHTYRDAKRMAKVLESYLREKNIDISHGESLNIIAKQFGLDDWNTLSYQPSLIRTLAPLAVGQLT